MINIAPGRIRRIRDEMRLWLRSCHGIRTAYSKDAIDRGREDLGFGSDEDALVAYTLFGGDLVPGMLDSLDLDVSPAELATIIESDPVGVLGIADLLDED